jgi:hypothetical protein
MKEFRLLSRDNTWVIYVLTFNTMYNPGKHREQTTRNNRNWKYSLHSFKAENI